ncbi:MAG: DUF58 domain-containing protein [Deltaproteobacteria bacterium]|jgi:uncharacterized protein (DUF58 family)|nr:DUF58 domain-containing protein [Deltaproteobacteria bacterium]
MARPSPRFAVLFALSAPLAALLLALFESRWSLALYLPGLCLALLAADYAASLPSGRLSYVLAMPSRLPLGLDFQAEAQIAAPPGARPTFFEACLELTSLHEEPGADGGPPAGQRPVLEAELESPSVSGLLREGRLSLSLPLRPRRRGRFFVKALWLRWSGPLGLVRLSASSPVGRSVDVIQNIAGLHEAALNFFSREADPGRKIQPFRGEGSEFDSLTDYAQGMDTRFIDWKRSARHKKLVVKEFVQERNHQIVLCFDVGRLMTEPAAGLPKLDHFIRSGLLLSWVSLRSGDLVGAAAFDLAFRDFLKPAAGPPFFARLQRFTAALSYRAEETNFTAGLSELQARLSRRALIVLFTEFIDPVTAEFLVDGLKLLTKRHMVVVVTMPDPLLTSLRETRPRGFGDLAQAVIAEEFSRERAIVRQRAVRLGAHCLEAPAGVLSTALLNRYLLVKQKGLL